MVILTEIREVQSKAIILLIFHLIDKKLKRESSTLTIVKEKHPHSIMVRIRAFMEDILGVTFNKKVTFHLSQNGISWCLFHRYTSTCAK